MIARMWRGATAVEDGDRYAAYLDRTGVASCRATPGNRGVVVLRRTAGDREEFTFVSFWDDLAAIRRFAGPEPEVARFFPEDAAYLVERETRVTHWEVEPEAGRLAA